MSTGRFDSLSQPPVPRLHSLTKYYAIILIVKTDCLLPLDQDLSKDNSSISTSYLLAKTRKLIYYLRKKGVLKAELYLYLLDPIEEDADDNVRHTSLI